MTNPSSFEELSTLLDSINESNNLSHSAHCFLLNSMRPGEGSIFLGSFTPPNDNFTTISLLSIWDSIRSRCYTANINLIGHATDNEAKSLAALRILNTVHSVHEKVVYIGLRRSDYKYWAPYFSRLPSIAFPDVDHLKRLFLRALLNANLELIFFQENNENISATYKHILELKKVTKQLGV